MPPTLFPSILPEDADSHHADPDAEAEAVAADGSCPWCDEAFENVPAHASQIHPEEWDEHKRADK